VSGAGTAFGALRSVRERLSVHAALTLGWDAGALLEALRAGAVPRWDMRWTKGRGWSVSCAVQAGAELAESSALDALRADGWSATSAGRLVRAGENPTANRLLCESDEPEGAGALWWCLAGPVSARLVGVCRRALDRLRADDDAFAETWELDPSKLVAPCRALAVELLNAEWPAISRGVLWASAGAPVRTYAVDVAERDQLLLRVVPKGQAAGAMPVPTVQARSGWGPWGVVADVRRERVSSAPEARRQSITWRVYEPGPAQGCLEGGRR
jgi:hypothetical protein